MYVCMYLCAQYKTVHNWVPFLKSATYSAVDTVKFVRRQYHDIRQVPDSYASTIEELFIIIPTVIVHMLLTVSIDNLDFGWRGGC